MVNELYATKRDQVLVDINKEALTKNTAALKDLIVIVGDATDDNPLIKAGIAGGRDICHIRRRQPEPGDLPDGETA